MKKYKSTDLAKLKRKLEIIFNQYIRLRDCHDGIGTCISCNKTYGIDKLQAGHFWSKGAYPALRFDERNVNSQCGGCNTFRHGAIGEYRIGLVKKLGQEVVDQLEQDRNAPRKYTVYDLLELIEIYQNRVKELS